MTTGCLKRIAGRLGAVREHEAQAWVKDSLLLAESGSTRSPARSRVADAALAHASPNVRLAGDQLAGGPLATMGSRPVASDGVEGSRCARR
jgi:hypothetical protein